MKKLIIQAIACVSMAVLPAAKATVLYSESFSYANGNLTNGTTWFQTGAASAGANPIQVSSGVAALGTSGQDVYSPLSSIYTIPNGTSLFFSLTMSVVSAQTTGDYFFHYTPTVGDSSLFFSRVWAKSSGAGYVLGYSETSGAGSVTNWGSTVLSFSTSYNMVLVYNAITAALNNTASIYVDPTDPTLANNTAYILNDTWTSASAENLNVAAVNLRQGAAASAPGLTVDNILVATSFNDIVAVPEPSTVALSAIGGFAFLFAFRRRR
jgi:hypothetical protein